jgi:cytochrome c-type biogenesis protein CcmF
VGPPYFNTVLWPMLMPLLFLMALGPLFHWQAQDIQVIWRRLRWTFLLSLFIALLLPRVLTGQWMLHVVIGVALALWIFLATLQGWVILNAKGERVARKVTPGYLGMTLAHIGVAITLVGIILTTALGEQREVRLRVNESTTLGVYEFTFGGVRQFKGPNFVATQARVDVRKAGQKVVVLTPEVRFYPVQNNAQPRSAIHATVWRDVYAVLGRPLDKESWSLRFYVKPFIRWIWGGGVIMMIGGLLAAYARGRVLKRGV